MDSRSLETGPASLGVALSAHTASSDDVDGLSLTVGNAMEGALLSR
ncbi:hypothetical protein MHAS44199_02165 [Mycolicibacterium hassiacum DSM 44199]|nr:hypothetical protein [Mycolicibacterium hassiacum DSM 44199]